MNFTKGTRPLKKTFLFLIANYGLLIVLLSCLIWKRKLNCSSSRVNHQKVFPSSSIRTQKASGQKWQIQHLLFMFLSVRICILRVRERLKSTVVQSRFSSYKGYLVYLLFYMGEQENQVLYQCWICCFWCDTL